MEATLVSSLCVAAQESYPRVGPDPVVHDQHDVRVRGVVLWEEHVDNNVPVYQVTEPETGSVELPGDV